MTLYQLKAFCQTVKYMKISIGYIHTLNYRYQEDFHLLDTTKMFIMQNSSCCGHKMAVEDKAVITSKASQPELLFIVAFQVR